MDDKCTRYRTTRRHCVFEIVVVVLRFFVRCAQAGSIQDTRQFVQHEGQTLRVQSKAYDSPYV